MSSVIVNAIWNYKGGDLNGTQTAIFVRMAWYASDAGRDIFPSVATLCEQTKFKKTAVRETIQYLIEQKFLIRMITSKGRHTNTYKINLERLKLVDEFDQNSSKLDESAKRTDENQPSAKRTVNPPPNGLNPPPGDTIKTIKDESKNNNSVVDEKMIKKALKVGISEIQLEYLIKHNKADKVMFQLEALSNTKGVVNPIGWLTEAVKRDYAPHKANTAVLAPPAYEMWDEKKYRQECLEREKLIDPNHWADQMLNSSLKN